MLDIPYIPGFFTDISEESPALPLLSLDSELRSLFRGEIFKLLCIGTDTRETPSAIDLSKDYMVSDLPKKARFIYYILVDGKPVFSSYFGNIPFLRNEIVSIDTNRLISMVEMEDAIYYVIQVTTTPNLIVTDGSPIGSGPLKDTYSEDGIEYNLSALGDSLTNNSFYAYLTIPVGTDVSYGFNVRPKDLIAEYVSAMISETEYKFIITPAAGVKNLDLRITVARS
jgi:hypothetical protein